MATQLMNIRVQLQTRVNLTPKPILFPFCSHKGLPEVPQRDHTVMFLLTFVYAVHLPEMTLTPCLLDVVLYIISKPP